MHPHGNCPACEGDTLVAVTILQDPPQANVWRPEVRCARPWCGYMRLPVPGVDTPRLSAMRRLTVRERRAELALRAVAAVVVALIPSAAPRSRRAR